MIKSLPVKSQSAWLKSWIRLSVSENFDIYPRSETSVSIPVRVKMDPKFRESESQSVISPVSCDYWWTEVRTLAEKRWAARRDMPGTEWTMTNGTGATIGATEAAPPAPGTTKSHGQTQGRDMNDAKIETIEKAKR